MASNGLDDTDKLLLRLLSEDSRASAAGLAQEVGLTRQAVTERLGRLKEDGVLTSFTIAVSPDRLGLILRAFIAITLLPACSEKQEQAVLDLLERSPWVRECYRVTGDDYFLARIVTSDVAAVRQLVLDLRATGVVQATRTTLALETMFEKSTAHYQDVLGLE